VYYEKDGIDLYYDDELNLDEVLPQAEKQIAQWKTQGKRVTSVKVTLDPADPAYILVQATERKPFERIRRITGYLVGTLDRFNDGKRSEERDRCKHAKIS
jgi:hypothetical protein